MWMHIKDDQPIPGSYIKILYGGLIVECSSAKNNVLIDDTHKVIKHDDFEYWRYKENAAS